MARASRRLVVTFAVAVATPALADQLNKGGPVDPMEATKKLKEKGALPQGSSTAPAKPVSTTYVSKVPESEARKACNAKCDTSFAADQKRCEGMKKAFDSVEVANCRMSAPAVSGQRETASSLKVPGGPR